MSWMQLQFTKVLCQLSLSDNSDLVALNYIQTNCLVVTVKYYD